MSSPDILFKGIPRGATRGYTERIIQRSPESVVIPCTGSFSLAYVAREGGMLGDQIFCGDISLYSTALGHAIMGTEFRLAIKSERGDIVRPYMDDPVSRAAAVLFMVRLLQYDGKVLKHHKRDMQRELMLNVEVYINHLREQIGNLAELLRGLTYRAQDMWVTLDEFSSNPNAVLLVNPPRYTGGYDRMFAGIDSVFDWDEPSAEQFTEKDYARLMELLAEQPALTLMYYATQGEDPSPLWGQPWRAVFADVPASKGRSAINWIIANRDPLGADLSRARITKGKAKYKLFDGHVRPDSDIRALRIDKATGDYYRDLFIHKLPGSVTEVYVALLIDGSLSGIIGLHLADLRRGKVVKKGARVLDHCASVTFAFTVQHEQYSRLHKLTLGSIISTWFWADVLGSENWYELNGAPRNVKTVMLSPYPENKTARGIMKQDGREKQPDGTYKLHYSAEVIDQNRADILTWWLDKYGVLDNV